MRQRGRPSIHLRFPERLLGEYQSGSISGRDLAQRFHVSLGVVLRELRRAGLDPSLRRGRHPINLQFPKSLLQEYASGKIDHHDVANRYHVCPRIALRELRRAGQDTSIRTRKLLRQARCPWRIRRDAQVVKRYEQGWNLRDIAAEIGLTQEGVRQILLRKGVARRPPGRSCA